MLITTNNIANKNLLKTTGFILSFVVGCLSLVGIAFAADVPGVVNNIATADIDRHAWNDVVGWIDFGSDATAGTGEVEVTDTQLKGYANILQAGFLALDCATSPNGDICATSGFKVLNDGSGNLSGWGWNDNIGWVSFSGTATDGSPYGVTISGSSGDFSGWAWNDVVGWISFNCVNLGPGSCNTAPPPDAKYKVNTSWSSGPDIDPPTGGPTGITPGGGGGGGGSGGSTFDENTWLISSVFDTQVQGGAALNTVMWLGEKPGDTAVGIQIASSNCPNGATNYPACTTGDWTYVGPAAPGIPKGNDKSAYEAVDGKQFRLNPADHNNKRYFRYKVYLFWRAGDTPEVQDVIINYSP
ncbi:MAG: hypothetical protein Q7S83_04000 [bacterium]|nr:hypothetical protein [bacterium]